MTLNKHVKIGDFKIRLDFSLNCKSENVIYIGICKICKEFLQCYFGQTCNAFHIRINGHRGCFKTDNFSYEKSAFSMHSYEEHLKSFIDKLYIYDLGIIIKQVKYY